MQIRKENEDLTRKVDKLEIQQEHLKLEKEQHIKDLIEANKDKSKLQLELSATRLNKYLNFKSILCYKTFISMQGPTGVW